MRILRATLMLLVLLAMGWYLYAHGEEFLLLREFDIRYLFPMLCVPLVGLVLNGLIMRLLVFSFGVQLTFLEWYGLTALHAFGNYLPIPQAGSLARGLYLKKRHRLDYSSFSATVLVTYVQFLVSAGMLGLLTAALMGVWGQGVPLSLWLLFAALTATAVILTPARWRLPLGRRLQPFLHAIEILRQRRVVFQVALYQVLFIGISAVGLWLAFLSLGRPVSLLASLLLTLVITASGIVNVTPGNLGVSESAAWITAHLIRANAHEAVVAYALFRVMAVLIVLVLTPFFASRLSSNLGSAFRNQ